MEEKGSFQYATITTPVEARLKHWSAREGKAAILTPPFRAVARNKRVKNVRQCALTEP